MSDNSLDARIIVLIICFLALADFSLYIWTKQTFNINNYLNEFLISQKTTEYGTEYTWGITRLIIAIFILLMIIIYAILATTDVWTREPFVSTAISALIAFSLLLADAYFIFWENQLWEPLEGVKERIPLISWKWLDFVHVLLWLAILFFGMISYANLRDALESPAGWLDFALIIPIIAIFLALILNEWITILFLAFSGLEPLYFYAAIGKSENLGNRHKKRRKRVN
jgi:hypothetical protein